MQPMQYYGPNLYVWIFAVACILAATTLQISPEADFTLWKWFTVNRAAPANLRAMSRGTKTTQILTYDRLSK